VLYDKYKCLERSKSEKILTIFELYFSHHFVKKDWGYLQKTLMATDGKDGDELIVPVYL
jgi:hypothetical protein